MLHWLQLLCEVHHSLGGKGEKINSVDSHLRMACVTAKKGNPWPPLENLVSPTYRHRRGWWQSYPVFIWCPESKGHMASCLFFPVLACKWGRSISEGLSHEWSWTLAGMRPSCPGLSSAAVIQYMIFMWRWSREFEKGKVEGRGEQEAGKGWGVMSTMGWKQKEEKQKRQQRSVQNWKEKF